MLKPRRLHRREGQKERLYQALRALYADGVRVCTGRADGTKLLRPNRRPQAPRPERTFELEEPGRTGRDPYNTSAR